MNETPPGWYPDPDHAGQQRYWDGQAWTAPPATGLAQASPQPRRRRPLRTILLVVTGLFVLTIGGCLALVAVGVNEVDKAIDRSTAAAQEPGGADNPLIIMPGRAFEVRGMQYHQGWGLRADVIGHAELTGLKVTNGREVEDEIVVEVKLWRGSEVLASVHCSTDGIAVGTTVSPNCFSSDKLPKNYERVTINDAF